MSTTVRYVKEVFRTGMPMRSQAEVRAAIAALEVELAKQRVEGVSDLIIDIPSYQDIGVRQWDGEANIYLEIEGGYDQDRVVASITVDQTKALIDALQKAIARVKA